MVNLHDLDEYNYMMVVDLKLRTFRDLRACLKVADDCTNFSRTEFDRSLIAKGWRILRVERAFGLYDAQAIILGK